MNSVDDLLDMIYMEGVEGDSIPDLGSKSITGFGGSYNPDLPPITYRLELIQNRDGTLQFVE